jgi:phage tail-like protein
MALTTRSFAGGYYVVQIDNKDLGIVQSVEGGGIKADLLTQPIGVENVRVKNIGGVTYEPLTFTLGASLSETFYKWVQDSWSGNYSRKDGSVMLCDFELVPRHEIEFTQGLIVETTVPALDASGKGVANLIIKVQAEGLKHNTSPNANKTKGLVPKEQKQFQTANFSFELDHVKTGNVTKVESFTIKQGVKPMPNGRQREPQWEPTSLEYPNVTITTALQGAEDLFKWHKKFVIDGDAQVEDEVTGTIKLLDTSMKKSLLEIAMTGVGITSLGIEKSDAAQGRSGVKRVKAELYVTEMKFNYKVEAK